MVYFVGAGPGAEDLITVRGMKLLQEADLIIYAGSLVNPALLNYAKKDCTIYNSAVMTLPQVLEQIRRYDSKGKLTVRLHTGDPCLYGAIREQMDALLKEKIPYEVCPGVSSFCAAAAAIKKEYTLPGVSQSVIITRAEGRTAVPDCEKLSLLAAHGATMVLFLSTGLLKSAKKALLMGKYTEDTPCAIVYKASWPEEKIVYGTLEELPDMAAKNQISNTALVLLGDFLGREYELSRLYAPEFSTGYREAEK